MKRGDLVLVAMSGDYGKVRPAVVIQHDGANETHASIVVCPLSTHLTDAPLIRIDIEPHEKNGLNQVSQIMVDKIAAVRRERIRQTFGRLDDAAMVKLTRLLAMWLGF